MRPLETPPGFWQPQGCRMLALPRDPPTVSHLHGQTMWYLLNIGPDHPNCFSVVYNTLHPLQALPVCLIRVKPNNFCIHGMMLNTSYQHLTTFSFQCHG